MYNNKKIVYAVLGVVLVALVGTVAYKVADKLKENTEKVDSQIAANEQEISKLQGDVDKTKDELGKEQENPNASEQPQNPETPEQPAEVKGDTYSADVEGVAVATLQTKYQTLLGDDAALIENAEAIEKYFATSDRENRVPWYLPEDDVVCAWKFMTTGKFEDAIFAVMWQCEDLEGNVVAYATAIFDGYDKVFRDIDYHLTGNGGSGSSEGPSYPEPEPYSPDDDEEGEEYILPPDEELP